MASLKKFLRYSLKIEGGAGYQCFLDEIMGRSVVRPVTICGYRMHVRTNTKDLALAISSFHEKEYENIRISDPRVIVDAGANIGTSSIYFATRFPESRIYAIEPEAGNFELLQRNVKDFPNVIPIQAAIWGEDCTRTIQNRFTGNWGFTVSETNNKIESTGQEVDCITISTLMKKYELASIDLLKMDIEGGEKDVLEHAQNWIDSVNTITIELHDRICMGCDRAFYLATKDFSVFEKNGEKVTAYRQ